MIKRTCLTMLAAVLLAFPAAAQADFGIVPGSVRVAALNQNGTLDSQAGSHPYEFVMGFDLKTDGSGRTEGGAIRNLVFDLPPGWVGDPFATPACSRQKFERPNVNCPIASQVGVLHVNLPVGTGEAFGPIYNLDPEPGVAAQVGFSVEGLVSTPAATVRTDAGYGVRVSALNAPIEVTSVTAVIWGAPAESGHDAERGIFGGAPSGEAPRAFITLPASCGQPLKLTASVDSRLAPGQYQSESGEAVDSAGHPVPLDGCESVPFSPAVTAAPTTKLATNPSGLDFTLKLPDNGLESPGGTAETEPHKVTVALPDGLTINPSFAEGVGVCSEEGYAREALDSLPGEGCPEASKLGSVVIHSPLLDESLEGSLYLAAPYENEFATLGALYLVARAHERGVFVKQAGKIEFDQATGKITSTFEELPPLPFSEFKLHFREGARAPLVTPRACGEYKTLAELYPFSAPSTATERTASFQVTGGADGGPCPPDGTPPFHPGLEAGSINNAAGTYSPFNVRLSRTDSEQEITHFSIKLPPGVTGKLAGVPFCADASIAAAKAREGTRHGSQEELEHPSCPAASEIGHTLAGAGVGSSLTYVPGKVYLAGPYKGSNLSIVAITTAKAGPFDLGTVVVRDALKINPETAEVSVDGGTSDPLPHIIDGIPVDLRDIRVYVDRPEFVLNPTNCEPTSTASTVLGSGTNFASEADDRPVTVTTRYQAASCASLGFKPKVQINLKGSTKRTGLPALKAVVTPTKGDANIRKAVVTLPKSEFLEQGHIGTTCTRVQFNAGGGNGERCPAKSVYGHAVATTPLLSEPLEGPVFLRSNGGERNLPDLVAALHSANVDIDLVGYISSLHEKGSDISRIRTSFATAPDAPLSRFTLEMFGGKKGLLINATNLCKGTHKALAELTGQNGKQDKTEPVVKAQCGRKKGKKGAGKGKKKSRAQLEVVAGHLTW